MRYAFMRYAMLRYAVLAVIICLNNLLELSMNIFPSGIAEGDDFCNRIVERERLAAHILGIRHTVLIAPRRYGKTSLIRQTLIDKDFIYVWVDFLSVTNKEDIENKISKACKELILKLAPELKKIGRQAKELIKSMSPELNLSAMGQSLSLHLTSTDKVAIDTILLEIDEYAQKTGKKAVVVFDEFQQISEIKENESVEALIRHAVERSKAITYIFSGSNRHMLSKMFSKSNRPLYRLCQAMVLDRIGKSHYSKFLNKAAQEQWKRGLSDGVIDVILDLTECHPFYVNALCGELWIKGIFPETEDQVKETWECYIDAHKSIIVADMVNLALNQKRIIKILAQVATKEPFGSDFCLRTKLSNSSVQRAVASLLLKDIIYVNAQGEYCLLDPALKCYLSYV